MLMIQGRYGSDVLAYSESLESVSFTSTSTEVVRGLGYWLFYIRDSFAATTTASLDYLASIKIIAIGVALLAACLVGLVDHPLGSPSLRGTARSASAPSSRSACTRSTTPRR